MMKKILYVLLLIGFSQNAFSQVSAKCNGCSSQVVQLQGGVSQFGTNATGDTLIHNDGNGLEVRIPLNNSPAAICQSLLASGCDVTTLVTFMNLTPSQITQISTQIDFTQLTTNQIIDLTEAIGFVELITNLNPTEQAALCQAIIDAGCDLSELVELQTLIENSDSTTFQTLIDSLSNLDIPIFTVNGIAPNGTGTATVAMGEEINFFSSDNTVDITVTQGSANVDLRAGFEHPDAGYAFCNTEDNLTNGGGGSGPFSTETTFTPHADGNYVFNYSGEVLSGTGGISVGTTSGANDVFVSTPATGDADGSRLTTTRQSNFTPALALQGGVTYFITQWAGGGGNIDNHTVCVADENLGNYIATQVNNAPIPLGWEIGSSIPSSGTVVVEDEHSYLYVQIPDGTTTLDVTGMTVGREFEIRMHPQDNIGDLTISLSDGSNIISDPAGGVNGANSTFTLLGGKNSDQGQVVRFRKMSNGQIWVTNVYPEPSSGAGHADDDVESVTGEHVDNTDPRNPIVKTWIKEECYKKEGTEVLTVSSNLNVVAANITQPQPVSTFSILCKNNGATAKALTMNFAAIGAGSIVSSNTLAAGETGFYEFDLGGSFTFVNGTMDPLNDADISMIALPVGSTGAITAAFGPLNGRVVVSSLDNSSSALISKVRTYDDGSTYEVDTDGNVVTPLASIPATWELTHCLSSEDETRVSELANESIETYTCELPCASYDPSGFALQTVPLTPIDYQDALVETRYLGFFDGGFATATGLAVPQANSFYSTHFNGTDWVIQTNNDPLNQVVFTPNANTYLIARVELGASGASLESFAFECGDDVNGFQTIPQFGGLTISDNTFNGSGNAGELDVSGTWLTEIISTVTICEGFNDLNSKLSNNLADLSSTPTFASFDVGNVPNAVHQSIATNAAINLDLVNSLIPITGEISGGVALNGTDNGLVVNEAGAYMVVWQFDLERTSGAAGGNVLLQPRKNGVSQGSINKPYALNDKTVVSGNWTSTMAVGDTISWVFSGATGIDVSGISISVVKL